MHESTLRTLLRFAPAKWVRGLAWGALLVGVGVALLLLMLATATALGPFSARSALAWRIATALGGQLAVIPLVPIAVGLLLLSRPDPSQLYVLESWSARRAMRYCLYATAVVILTMIPLAGVAYGLQAPRARMFVLLTTAAALAASLVLLALALMRHLAALLRRVPSLRMGREAIVVAWLILPLAVLRFVHGLTMPPARNPLSANWVFNLPDMLGIFVNIAAPLLALWIAVLLFRAQRRFFRVASED